MTFNLFMVKQKVQMWCKNTTFPQLHVLFIVQYIHSSLMIQSITKRI